MSSFKNILALTLVTLFVSACGFTPMYGGTSGTAIARANQSVEIDNIPDRDGQFLRNALIDRLYINGTPDNPAYVLQIVNLHREIVNMGIRKDATATRGEVTITAKLRLLDKTSGAVVLERDLKSIGSYNLLDNQFATLVSKESVTDHVLNEMSDNITSELGLYFHRVK